MKKIKMVFVVMVGSVLAWSNLPYHYCNEKAAVYASRHAARGSRSMCAWYVVRAMWRGGSYRIYRATNGWHWKHVWTSPADWYSWIESLVKGYKKIKF